MAPHKMPLPCDRCTRICPKLICAGVGLKLYLSAGIASAAATRFFPILLAWSRNASDTGFDCAIASPGARAAARPARQIRTRMGLARVKGGVDVDARGVLCPGRSEEGTGGVLTGCERTADRAQLLVALGRAQKYGLSSALGPWTRVPSCRGAGSTPTSARDDGWHR